MLAIKPIEQVLVTKLGEAVNVSLGWGSEVRKAREEKKGKCKQRHCVLPYCCSQAVCRSWCEGSTLSLKREFLLCRHRSKVQRCFVLVQFQWEQGSGSLQLEVGVLSLNSGSLSSLPSAKSTGCLWREERVAEKNLKTIVCAAWHQLWQLLKAGPPGMKQGSWTRSNQLCRNLMLRCGKRCLPMHARACPDPSHLDLQETVEGKFTPRAHQKICERPSCSVSLPHCSSHRASLAEHHRAAWLVVQEAGLMGRWRYEEKSCT